MSLFYWAPMGHVGENTHHYILSYTYTLPFTDSFKKKWYWSCKSDKGLVAIHGSFYRRDKSCATVTYILPLHSPQKTKTKGSWSLKVPLFLPHFLHSCFFELSNKQHWFIAWRSVSWKDAEQYLIICSTCRLVAATICGYSTLYQK